MEIQLELFEEYVGKLAKLGVFPSFNRYYHGWICNLRNGLNRQIMPLDENEQCWGETLLAALTLAVDSLNKHFPNPAELHKYIDTGLSPNVETRSPNVEDFHKLKL